MVDNLYAVAPNFPVGVLLSQLKLEMPVVWTDSAIFPITMVHRGGSGTGGVITTGNITIMTQRALTTPENDAALAHFQTHVPVLGAIGGINTADLGEGSFNGAVAYVLDQARQGNGSTGGFATWDGRDRTWRRVRDDVVISTIP